MVSHLFQHQNSESNKLEYIHMWYDLGRNWTPNNSNIPMSLEYLGLGTMFPAVALCCSKPNEQWLRSTPVGWWLVRGYYPSYIGNVVLIQEEWIPFSTNQDSMEWYFGILNVRSSPWNLKWGFYVSLLATDKFNVEDCKIIQVCNEWDFCLSH
jgi:hypothetical protein